jgi:ferredoxin
MKRTVIEIDRDACIGCGQCANACHQGAIQMVDGKAKLVREDHCDGLGRCLPHCPVDAIELVEKEINIPKPQAAPAPAPCACPSTVAKKVERKDGEFNGKAPSRLNQWPCQIQLINPAAPYLEGADLLIAADCCSFAYGNFHDEFMKDKITIIGCPKLDQVDYSDKLTDILTYNNIKSITVTRMTVPCCGGLPYAVEAAVKKSGKNIPLDVRVISTDGELVR